MEVTKRFWIFAALALLVAFAFGRFSAPEKVKIEKEIVKVEVEKTDQTVKLDRDKTVIEVTKPDGTKYKKTVTKTEKDTDTHTDKSTTEIAKESKTVEAGRSRVTLSALAGVNPFDLTAGISYGGHISKPILGPIAIGVWGLSSGTFGLSVGLQF